jgi:hypothetical protein
MNNFKSWLPSIVAGVVSFIAFMIFHAIATNARGYEAYGGECIAAVALGVAVGLILILLFRR